MPASTGRLDGECWCSKTVISPVALARAVNSTLEQISLRCLAALFLLVPAASFAEAPLYGIWQGQVEFQVYLNGNTVPESHSVVDTVLNIDPRGKIVGQSKENGCRILGLATPGPGNSKVILNISLNLAGCHYQGLNERFSGLFTVSPKDGYAVMNLSGNRIKLGSPSKSYFMKGNFRY